MLGAPEVGKTQLTNQFMSSSDVGTFNQLTGKLTHLLVFTKKNYAIMHIRGHVHTMSALGGGTPKAD